jgi:hypothetical protein
MQQNRQTGADGNAFGRKTAPLIAKSIGATMLGPHSNEAIYKGHRIVIKCAAQKTNSVGVTHLMLQRLHSVIGAFQTTEGSFEILSLPAHIFSQEMRPTRSQGASAGKVGITLRHTFQNKGDRIGIVRP